MRLINESPEHDADDTCVTNNENAVIHNGTHDWTICKSSALCAVTYVATGRVLNIMVKGNSTVTYSTAIWKLRERIGEECVESRRPNGKQHWYKHALKEYRESSKKEMYSCYKQLHPALPVLLRTHRSSSYCRT